MQTITVSTKEAFEKAVNNHVDKIIITGNLAQKIISSQKKKSIRKKIGIVGAIVAGVGGIALAPVTAGASAISAVASLVATTTTGTTVVMSIAELITLSAAALGLAGFTTSIIKTVAKNYDVKVSVGSTTVECTRK